MLERKLTVQELDLVLRRLEGLPASPAVIERVLSLPPPAQGDSPAGGAVADQLPAVVACDPALSAKMLSLANRRRGAPADGLGRALADLGYPVVRSAALSAPVGDDPSDTGGGGLERQAFAVHCLAVALAAEALAPHTPAPVEGEWAFACGLLHDLGKLVLDHCMPKTYRRVLADAERRTGPLDASERRIVGLDHSVVGRRLAELWRLGDSICRVIWLTHLPIDATPESIPRTDRALVAVVKLADNIARSRQVGFSGNFSPPLALAELAGRLGIDPEAAEGVAERLTAEVRSRLALAGLDQPAGRGRRRRTLVLANAELGRLNEQLRLESRRLAGRAEGARHLESFLSGLRADAAVWDVLVRIAEVATAAGAPGPVAAYAVGDEQAHLPAVRLDPSGRQEMRTFARGGGESSPPAPDASPPAPEELGEWIDLSSCGHVPLTCAGAWVGGVLYTAPSADADAGEARTPLPVWETLAPAMALALAATGGRRRAVLISEQLAAASEDLAARQDSLAEERTLESISRLAAGAAHELNNPLAVISGRAQLMTQRATTDEERQTWRLIAEQAQRLSDVISELMDFASPPAASPSRVDVAALLSETSEAYLRWAEETKAAVARVDIETGRDLAAVTADADQIRAVMLELLRNAARAAGPQGRIRLAAENDEQDEAVLITVSDDGGGMDAETLADAFTPFFSVQQAGRRRGLGLPRARRYVENSGGRIWVRSKTGEGTTVYVQLPKAKGEGG